MKEDKETRRQGDKKMVTSRILVFPYSCIPN